MANLKFDVTVLHIGSDYLADFVSVFMDTLNR